ncbi:hypothetical protein H0H92_006757, partial [Tricholoma furcatifolium]
MSQKEKDQILRKTAATVAGQDEEEDTEDDIHHPATESTCFMRKVLSEQADFRSKKLLLQIVIEAAGHKKGLNATQAEYAVRKYRSHRRI